MTIEKLQPLEQHNELALTDEERTRVISFFDVAAVGEKLLEAVNTENVERMVHVIDLTNMLREDVCSQPFRRDDLLEGAPEHTDGYWQVPRLID